MTYDKLLQIEDSKILYACGDIHGEFNAITYTIKRHDIYDATVIVCGDIGIGFEKEAYYNNEFNRIEKVCEKRNTHVVFTRGNHDDPCYFDGTHFTNYKYIHVVKDYTIVNVCGNNVLCVGGAISVDRYLRINRNTINELNYKKHHSHCSDEELQKCYPKVYWENENVVFDDYALMSIKENNISIDFVCSHTAPDFAYPFDKGNIASFLALDKELEKDLQNERKMMTDLYTQLIADGHNIRTWCYGHFHMSHMEIIDATKFELLNMSYNGDLDIKPITFS